MKGLILSGGHGTRLRPITYSQQKQLIPVANKPVLFYAIEDIINAGIKEIGIITGPNREQVIETVNSVKWDAKIEFIHQGDPKGIAHAVLVAEEFIGNDSFVLYLGDNILFGGIKEFKEKFEKSNSDALILVTEVDHPERFGVVIFDENRRVKKLIEKPKEPLSKYALVGVYFFKPSIFEACKNIKPSWRNELEITDAIQWLIDNGYKVEVEFVKGWWKDTGTPEDILEVNRYILDLMINYENKGKITNSKIIGRVKIDENTIIENSVIKGPAIIGKNTIIKNSYIGPYTSIGNNCYIENSEIEDSIIMDGCKIIDIERMSESLIGKDVNIKKTNIRPKTLKFVIGDRSSLEI
ncbi:glucose-1-phosphate thymidylyltransferase (EC 2.7.7.24) [Nanoarchaeota archaeon]